MVFKSFWILIFIPGQCLMFDQIFVEIRRGFGGILFEYFIELFRWVFPASLIFQFLKLLVLQSI
jgi:hypothetical protein